LPTESEWSERGQQGESFAFALPPGRYFATQNAQQGNSRTELYNSGPTPSTACAEAPQLQVAFDGNLTLAVTVTTPDSSFLIVEDLTAVGVGYRLACSPGTTVSWCDGCGQCRPGCDSNVTVSEPRLRPRLLRLRVDERPEHGFWVRLTRTL
jgi:hypothetical protein